MVGAGKAMFCGKREPECLRHMVHWQIPFWGKLVGEAWDGVEEDASGWPVFISGESDAEADGITEAAA